MGDLFAFTVPADGQIRIPKAALPGLDNPENITAVGLFGAVILRTLELDLAKQSSSAYPDFATGKIIKLFRTEIKFPNA